MRGIQCVSPWPWPLSHHTLCYPLPLRVSGTCAKLPPVKAQRTWQMLLLVLSPHLRLHLTSWRSFIIFFFLAGSGETKCLIFYGHKSLNAGIQDDKQIPHQQASRCDPKSAALIQPPWHPKQRTHLSWAQPSEHRNHKKEREQTEHDTVWNNGRTLGNAHSRFLTQSSLANPNSKCPYDIKVEYTVCIPAICLF